MRIPAYRIVSVGVSAWPTVFDIDAEAVAASPGFVARAHTSMCSRDSIRWPKPILEHGVTTVVTGNCFLSLAPTRTGDPAKIEGMFLVIEGQSYRQRWKASITTPTPAAGAETTTSPRLTHRPATEIITPAGQYEHNVVHASAGNKAVPSDWQNVTSHIDSCSRAVLISARFDATGQATISTRTGIGTASVRDGRVDSHPRRVHVIDRKGGPRDDWTNRRCRAGWMIRYRPSGLSSNVIATSSASLELGSPTLAWAWVAWV